MRLVRLLLPLTFVVVALTSGCHHHHCCCGGCGPFSWSPCGGGCCCYTPPMIEGPMPPLAAPNATIVAPHTPMLGAR